MAASKETSIGIKLVADLRRYTNNLNKAQKQNKRYASQTKSTFSGLQNVFKNLAVTMGLTFGVSKVVSFAKESLRAYNIQAQAEQQLLVALKGRQITQQNLIRQAQKLQDTTLFGDEETIRAQALIAAFVREEDQIKKVIPLVQDLATAKGMDLAAAADLVSKTLGSSTNALSRYGIKVEGAVGSSERLESLMYGLNDAFGGQAAAAAKTGTGAITQLENKWGDLKEQIGQAIAESENFNQLMDEMSKSVTILSSKHLNFWEKINPFKSQEKTYQLAIKRQEEYDKSQQELAKTTDETTQTTNTNTAATEKQITTYGDLIQQITDKNKELLEADVTDQANIRTIYNQIKALEDQKKAFENLANGERQKIVMPEMQSKTVNSIETTAVDSSTLAVKKLREEMEGTFSLTDKIDQMSSSFGILGSVIGGVAGGFLQMAAQMFELIPQLISQIVALTAAKQGEAIASGTAAANKVPFPLNIIAMAATMASIISAFSKIPKFATGGVVGGNSFFGDNVIARVNSGEEILTRNDPRHRYNKGATGGDGPSYLPADVKIMEDHILISYERAIARRRARTGK